MRGVCAGATKICGGEQGWLDCAGPEYGSLYDGEEETRCDGLDNNCDGQIDEGCGCRPEDVQVCGSEVGLCQQGIQSCESGEFGECEGEVVADDEICDGLDNDCDGDTDEALSVLCPLQLGVCAGVSVDCQEGVFAQCGEAQYGARYLEDEGLFQCDGFDNDCDGMVDELCFPPQIIISELLFDEVGQDTGHGLFLELTGQPLSRLGGLRLEAVNGRDGGVYDAIDLPNAQMPFNGVFLIVGQSASQVLQDLADLVVEDVNLQNGPDSLQLIWNKGTFVEQTLDAVGYGSFSQSEIFAGEGTAATNPPPGQSLTRDDSATDTDDNSADFVRSSATVLGVPTPGGPPLPKIHVRMVWNTDGDDLDLHLLRGGGIFGGEGDCHWLNRNPDWGVVDETLDDPRLDRDDLDGLGPEIIVLARPAEDSYLIQVQVWQALALEKKRWLATQPSVQPARWRTAGCSSLGKCKWPSGPGLTWRPYSIAASDRQGSTLMSEPRVPLRALVILSSNGVSVRVRP